MPRRITSREYGILDCLTLDWFPSLSTLVRQAQEAWKLDPRGRAFFTPTILAARGCPRKCEFCYGAYEERVFGKGIAALSPKAITRYLRKLEESPDFSYVTLVMLDCCVARPIASVLGQRKSRLGAQIYICGFPKARTIASLMNCFSGYKRFTLAVPPSDALSRFDPPMEQRCKRLLEVVNMFKSAPNAQLDLFIFEPYAVRPELFPQAIPTGEWRIVQPSANSLREGKSLEEHFEEVLEASRKAACGLLLNALLPGLENIPWVGPVPAPQWAKPDDPFLRNLFEASETTLMLHNAYGFEDLRLVFTKKNLDAFLYSATWMQPGRPMDGHCSWFAGLNGYEIEGEVIIENEMPVGIGLMPTVLSQGRWLSPQEWPKAKVPTVLVPPGPKRAVLIKARWYCETMFIDVIDRSATLKYQLRKETNMD